MMTIIDEISKLIEDFQIIRGRYPEVLVLNRNHKRDIFASSNFHSIMQIDSNGYPGKVMGLMLDVVDVPEMSVR